MPPKEKPDHLGSESGSKNTIETQARLSGIATPDVRKTHITRNTEATTIRELANDNQKRLLAKAANFASLHAPHTLWKREMGTGAAKVLIRLEWPGVLCVYCPKTGDKLATSAPGQPETIQ